MVIEAYRLRQTAPVPPPQCLAIAQCTLQTETKHRLGTANRLRMKVVGTEKSEFSGSIAKREWAETMRVLRDQGHK